ncbi:FAD-binding oxidoreductase [Phyllobacterium sp. YR531]|uniref:NAD(P)/FAD-dependent oxidoreductase n=1 Tax=Phyllobacterium sp. YR531 TaxID=1144343 RepID=UPI00026F98AF|nr:FAD-binding oxidoreductase [Phyllobacterium sp. YR531]EJN03646.1 glycine/D-amino acid oxidase, deaminating [Phyllobacterium sp. YR531]
MNYIDTFYRRTIADDRTFSVLAGTVDCDTCIIGGGLAGLTVALQLARAGHSVVVLEAQRVGWGASGRNGGFVSPGFANDGDAIARMAGADNARKLHTLSIEGARFVRDTINELNITSASPINGIMSVLRYSDEDAMKKRAEYLRNEFNYAVEYMDRDQVRAVLHSDRYFQAVRDPQAFHMHPLNYLRAVAREIERLGGKVFESSAATATDISRVEKIVETANGKVKARNVVITTGGYTTGLIGRLKRSYLPIATYVMLSEEAPDLISTAIATTDAVGDNRRAGDYYRVVEGGKRLLWGGRITTRAASSAAVAAELRREMVGTYPQLADLKTELSWSGLMSYARHLMPQIGQLQQGVWYCTAFGGHGLNTTAMGGKVVAEAILGQSERYKLFKPFGLAWAGGLAGLSVAQLTYWKLQAQDWWRERQA